MRRWLIAGSFAAAALAAFGAASTPGFLTTRDARVGLAAVFVILLAYGVAAGVAVPVMRRRQPQALALASHLGLAAGLVYAGEILLEYVILPANNSAWGLVEFGAVFLIFLTAGAIAAWRTRRFASAPLAALWTAMASALIWYVVLLAVFYAFRGGARQMAVLRAEGDFEDFARSGGRDFQAFLMGDFLGAGFYHLALSPVVAAVLGSLGGAAALATRAIVGRRPST